MSAVTEEIKRKLDVVELVGEYVRLNPAGGQSMKGLCPFHAEKSPSFFVHRDKQFWHCFGCSEGGDIFTFYQKIENLEFPDALKELARRAGVELPQFEPKAESERGKLLAVLEDAARFFEAALKHEAGARARAYLDKRRMKPETIAEFRIGYAPASWDAVTTALTKRGHDVDRLVAAGLAIASDKGRGHYDRFRDRVMIPLCDARGTVVGFTGRILPDSPEAEKTGKYVNTPETIVYHKRNLVFGLDKAKNSIKAANHVVIVEGNIDVIASHQAGVKNTVGVSGTAFTEDQLKLILRCRDQNNQSTFGISISFDADSAGKKATVSSLKLGEIKSSLGVALNQDTKVFAYKLPEGYKDPDDLIQKQPDIWKRVIQDSRDLIDYIFEVTINRFDIKDPYSAKKIVSALSDLFEVLEEGNKPVFNKYATRLAQLLYLRDEVVFDMIEHLKKKNQLNTGSSIGQAPAIETREERLAKRFFSLILSDIAIFKRHFTAFKEEWLPEGPLHALAKTVRAYYTKAGTSFEPRGFFSSYDAERRADSALPAIEPILLLKERDMAGWTDEQLNEEASLCARELEKSTRKRIAKELLGALGDAEKRGDAAAAKNFAKRLEELMKPAEF